MDKIPGLLCRDWDPGAQGRSKEKSQWVWPQPWEVHLQFIYRLSNPGHYWLPRKAEIWRHWEALW